MTQGTEWLSLINREPWQADAVCLTVDQGDLFYPEKGSSTRDAKTVCQHCPVIEECLSFALRTDQGWGVWGGRSERERFRIKRGEDVPFTIPGHRDVAINECHWCAEPFKGGRGKYCDSVCRDAARSAARRKRYEEENDRERRAS